MKAIIDGDITIAFDDEGEGEPIVLLHAFATDRSMWEPQITHLSKHWRVIAPDLRGFGFSDPADGAPVSMDRYAEDVAKLLDHLNVPAAVIGGLSLGGYVTLAFAQKYPERTKALILANTRASADDDAMRNARLALAKDVERVGNRAVVEAYDGKLLGPNANLSSQDFVWNMLANQPSSGAVSAILGMAARPDRRDFLKQVTVPTLIITGTADAIIPFAESESMHRQIVNSTFVNVPGAGHLSNVDNPTEFNLAVERFMGALGNPGRI
jgi:3-oxoadipate enol-lactonase